MHAHMHRHMHTCTHAHTHTHLHVDGFLAGTRHLQLQPKAMALVDDAFPWPVHFLKAHNHTHNGEVSCLYHLRHVRLYCECSHTTADALWMFTCNCWCTVNVHRQLPMLSFIVSLSSSFFFFFFFSILPVDWLRLLYLGMVTVAKRPTTTQSYYQM